MKACIFLGSSLPVDKARGLLPDATFLPPVQQGDVYAAVKLHAPSIIGIIDGYFQQRPSVWHKEILWAMSQGVHVYGAASMGALRAAELEAFGMVGIGVIFDAFRGGALPPFNGLVDDDEVAVIHGPPETGFLAVSDALVNIRHTLTAAQAQQIIDKPTHDELVEQARLTHFTERSYNRLLAQANESGVCRKNLTRLEDWLPNGKIDQKRIDAELLLQRVDQQMQQAHVPMHAQFNFEQTEIWRDAVDDMHRKQCELNDPDALQQAIIDELRLDEANYRRVKQSALLHCVFKSKENETASIGGTSEQPTSEKSLLKIADEYRRENSLLNRESVDAWLRRNDMEVVEFDSLMNHESRFRSVLNTPDTPAIVEALLARLRLMGDYVALAKRAREKQTVLADTPLNTLPAAQLLRWYFNQKHLQNDPGIQGVPDNIESYAKALGMNDEAQLIGLIRREHQFLSQIKIDKTPFSGDGL